MSEYTSLYAALLVLLGMVFHCKEFFVHDPVPYLNLFHGLELPDTWLNFFLTKCAAYLSLAGFLRAFAGPNAIGTCAGALLLATHPLFSMNSSRLGLFTASIALFWWLLVLAKEKKGLFYFVLPTVWIILCAFSLSYWMIALWPFCIKILEIRFTPSQKTRITLAVITLSFLILLITIQIFWAHPGSSLKPFLLLAGSITFIYHGACVFFFIACSVISAWLYPIFILGFLSCLVLSMILAGLDLGGILCLWAGLSGIAAMALNGLLENTRFFHSVWKKAFLLLVFFIFVLQFYHQEHFDRLLEARRRYSDKFYHQCGQPLEKKGISGPALWGIDSSHPSGECWLAFGNYHTCLPGKYQAKFRLISSQAEGSYVDVTQDNGKRILAQKYISDEHDNSGKPTFASVTIDYDIAESPVSPVEHRVHYGGKGILYFESVEIEAKS